MFGKILSYIKSNLMEEIHNFPLFIPVFIGIGIGFYFHLESEPKTWVVYLCFAISLLLLFFLNLGNSSDKFKHYKFVVAFSTFKYILRKFFKILLFTLFFPIIGHITLVVFIGGWIVSLFEYSYYLRYFAFFYDNSLMKGIWRGIKFLFRPVSKRFKKTKLYAYLKSVLKVSKSKKNVSRNEWKLLIKTTKSVVRFFSRIFDKIFNNPVFSFIVGLKNLFIKSLKNFIKRNVRYLKKNVSKSLFESIWGFIYSVNFIVFFIVLGFFVIKLRTNLLDTNLLEHKLKNQKIIARVIESENFENDYRLTLDNVRLSKDSDVKLDKIRIKFLREFGLPEIGKSIEFRASLIPPFEPDTFGSFNFARYSYFKKLSASGKSFDAWKYVDDVEKNSFGKQLFFDFLNFRNKINLIIQNKTSSDTSGVIMSMMTGERYSIPDKVSEDYKGAGISHLLAISGFHMTLIVGFVFFLVRFLLAFSVSFSNRYNTKKTAVLFAFLFSVFYLFISGTRLPSERAFIMSSLALLAVLLDRNPISLRFVAVSAIIILLLSPEALVNAGFQLSFIAVISLIRLYMLRDKIFIKYTDSDGSIKRKLYQIVNVVLANSLSSFLIGIAIIPFIIYNFNTVQIYSVLGNFFAIPLFTFIVMPAILFAFLLMPFGVEFLPLKVAEFGVRMINYFASKISVLPYASIDVKTMNLMPLLFIVFGLIWFLLWDRKWKRFGIISVLVGIVLYMVQPNPDVFGNKYSNIFAVNLKDFDVVNFSKYEPSRMLIDNWNSSIGKKNVKVVENRTFDISGVKVGFVDKFKDYKRACFENNILFVTLDKTKSFFNCRKPVFDRRFFKYAKGAEFFINKYSVKYKILRKYIGKRPWSLGRYNKDYNLFPEFKSIRLFNYR